MKGKAVVVAIIHTYARDRELGSYFQSLVDAFVESGVTLHLILTNDLVPNLGARGFSADVSERKLIAYINGVSPDFVFSTNRGGITSGMMREVQCPIVTWMVDRIPFLHHGGGHNSLFGERDYVVTSSTKNVARLESLYPVLKNRVHYLPFATNVGDFQRYSDVEQDVDISFVGTYFYCGQLTNILDTYKHDKKLVEPILKLVKRISENYDLDINDEVKELGLEYVLKDFDLDIFKFKGLLANAISLNRRVKCLDAVSDLGLRLYGTENWVNVNQFSLQLLSCYQFGEFIKTRGQLVNLYQRTKIGLNVSHHQAVDGLPYRIFDIMASRALLVSDFREDSDLYKLFGRDIPIPMYRDENDLRKCVVHFQKNESERRDAVNECNRLVRDGFSFQDRVKQFYDIVGLSFATSSSGKLLRVERSVFVTEKRPSRCQGSGSARKSGVRTLIVGGVAAVRATIASRLSPGQRLALKRLVRGAVPQSVISKIQGYMQQ